jgi:hypothetical protein
MKMTAAEKAEQAKQNQRQRNKNRDDFRKKSDARKRALREQMGYELGSREYANQAATNEKPGFEGRANRFLDKVTDDIGDAIRSGASAIGIDNDYDTGRMKARKETKGYKKGGKAKAKKYNKGGKVRGAGKAMKGVRPAKMVKMKGA